MGLMPDPGSADISDWQRLAGAEGLSLGLRAGDTLGLVREPGRVYMSRFTPKDWL
jgi:hypothetical protein